MGDGWDDVIAICIIVMLVVLTMQAVHWLLTWVGVLL